MRTSLFGMTRHRPRLKRPKLEVKNVETLGHGASEKKDASQGARDSAVPAVAAGR